MSKFRNLRVNPPKIQVKGSVREVIFTTISAMCDNVGTLKFKKNADGDFKISGMGFAISNWQMKSPTHDIEWAADDADWDKVIEMINSGTSVVEKVKSR